MLKFPDFTKRFQLLTDSSLNTLGAVLQHQPLRCLFMKSQCKKLNSRLYRWIINLSDFNLTVNFLKGKDNQIADFLSRIDNNSGDINILNTSSSSSL